MPIFSWSAWSWLNRTEITGTMKAMTPAMGCFSSQMVSPVNVLEADGARDRPPGLLMSFACWRVRSNAQCLLRPRPVFSKSLLI